MITPGGTCSTHIHTHTQTHTHWNTHPDSAAKALRSTHSQISGRCCCCLSEHLAAWSWIAAFRCICISLIRAITCSLWHAAGPTVLFQYKVSQSEWGVDFMFICLLKTVCTWQNNFLNYIQYLCVCVCVFALAYETAYCYGLDVSVHKVCVVLRVVLPQHLGVKENSVFPWGFFPRISHTATFWGSAAG